MNIKMLILPVIQEGPLVEGERLFRHVAPSSPAVERSRANHTFRYRKEMKLG